MIKESAEHGTPFTSSPLEGEPNRSLRFGGGYNPRNTSHAKNMRKKMTPWEFQLWERLKRKQLGGFKFRRQQPIGSYIVDFLNVECKLVIELDGSQHVENAADMLRDADLLQAGYRVLRFWNHDVNANIEGVLVSILEALQPPHQIAKAIWLPLEGGASEPVARGEVP
ncbi:MAG: endonuclease domain-containing protein [Pseudomonadota bacterium]